MRARISGHSSLRKRRALGIAQPRPGAGRDEHADAALDDDQPFVLEALIGLGHGQRVGLLLGGQRADRGQRVAVGIFAGEDRVGDRLAQADVNGLFVLGVEASCCHNTAEREKFNRKSSGRQAAARLRRPSSRRAGPVLELAAGMADEDEAGDPLAGSHRRRPRTRSE